MLGSSIALIGTFLSSFATNFNLFLLTYSFSFGLGVGICYLVPLTCAWHYFPNRKGLVAGIILGGYGFGAFIFSFISTAIINPNNLRPDVVIDGTRIFTQSEIVDKVPYMIRLLVLAWACLVGISLILIKGDPHKWEKADKDSHKNDLQIHLLNDSDEVIGHNEKNSKQKIEKFLLKRPDYAVLSFKQALLSINTLILWTMMIFSTSYGMFIAHVYKSYGILHINDDFFMTSVGSFGAMFNGGSRSIWSTLQDKYGFKRMFSILLVFQITLSATLVSIASLGDDSSWGKSLYMVWI
jgi:MFS transporter, OFA family, oxalate/formate antiporter